MTTNDNAGSKGQFMRVNINTVLTGIVTALLIGLLSNGWSINSSMIEVKANLRSVQAAQDGMAKQISDLMPRPEIMSRLQAIETRLAQVEADIVKLKDRK